jgi:hypothetical protein
MQTVRTIGVLGFALVLFSCGIYAETPPSLPVFSLPAARWTTYQFSWQAPAAAAAEPVPLTVAVVRPFAADKESVFADPAYRKLAKGFAQSMGVDLDKTLVAKGIKVSGPHETWDDMTYADKQTAHMALTPKVFLSAEIRHEPGVIVGGEQPGGGGGGRGAAPQRLDRPILLAAAGGALWAQRGGKGGEEPPPPAPTGPSYIERRFTMVLQGHIALEIREPLSNQKLWVKKLDLDPIEHKGIEYFEGPAGGVTGSPAEPEVTSRLLVDGKQEAMADVMQQWYPAVMAKVWRHLDPAELMSLKPQVDEIRKIKRY